MSDSNVRELPLIIRLFGVFEARIYGEPLPHLRTRKGQWLLALLVLRQRHPVERSFLAGVLWPESRENQALANLRLTLTDLRRALGPEALRLYAPSVHTLALDLTGTTVDVATFDRDITSHDPTLKKQAVMLYRGPLLSGCEEAWAVPEREARERTYLQALEALAIQAREQHDLASEADYWRLCLLTDPYRESALCALMEAAAIRGDTFAATRAYREFRLRLHKDLNAQPAVETTALYHRLMDPLTRHSRFSPPFKSSVAPPPVLPSLPLPLTELIGRTEEVESLCARLQETRLVTLKGPGGAGKTRLAIEVCKRLMGAFAGRVWFVSLVELPAAERLPEKLRDSLCLQPEPTTPLAQVVRYLSEQPALLILDSYEHLIAKGARFVQELLASVPSLICLVTSRHSLHLRGEIEYDLQPLALPGKRERVSRLLEFPGVQLFVERATSRRAEFQLTEENAEAIVALCTKLEGIPLAIELVAAWADVLTPSQMQMRLDGHFAFPGNQNTDIPERHRSLLRAFDGSYTLLEEMERRLLRRLSVFTGGWTLEAVEAVCGEARQPDGLERGNAIGSPQTLVLLKRLVEKSLVQFQGDSAHINGQPRYRLLEMTRRYAREHLSSSEQDEVEKRHANYFFAQALLGEAEIHANAMAGAQHRRMLPDKENFEAALQKWRTVDAEKALEMMLALDTCRLAQTREREDWMRRLEMQSLPAPSSLQAKLYFHAAIWALQRTLNVWLVLMERAYTLAQDCGDKTHMAFTLLYLGQRDLEIRDTGRARERLTTCLDYSLQIGYQAFVASAQKALILLACADQEFGRARQMSETLLRSGQESDHWATRARALEALGHIAAEQQEPSRACSYWEQALAAYPETETLPRSNTLRIMGRAVAAQGAYMAARTFLYESLVICQESGDLAHEAWTYHSIAEIAHRQGNEDEAMMWGKKALTIFDMRGEVWSVGVCLRSMARLSENRTKTAAFLWSAYEQHGVEVGAPFSSEQREEIDAAYASLQTSLPAEEIRAIRKRCSFLSLAKIIELLP